ncbi:hypothetical protein G210_3602 [Candida maltosa Xu316]|uniref:Uncharacterized protein n=1 Tax=Candida maltosa (strain Xu316) TaxID=1245528 RepID=M3JUV8_CANMX|nr:hypothetical protein G210_3602 [Candida maltosa Xu316]
MATTTKTKKKLIYKQDPDGVFRLKKIDDNASIKTAEVIHKKAQVDNYLNELIDCSYTVVDDSPKIPPPREPESVLLPEKEKISLPKKIKPTTNNTSSKNLKPKGTSPHKTTTKTTAILNHSPQPQHIPTTIHLSKSPSPTPQRKSPSPASSNTVTSIPSPSDYVPEKEVEEIIIPAKPSIMSRVKGFFSFHIPSFIIGIISAVAGVSYKDELIYGVLGLVIVGSILGILGVLALGGCLYLGVIKSSDIKIFDKYLNIVKARATEEQPAERIVINDEVQSSHHSMNSYQEENEIIDDLQHVEEEEEIIPEEDEELEEEEEYEPITHIPRPESYQQLPTPQPPKARRRSSASFKATPYRYEQREHKKKFNVSPIQTNFDKEREKEKEIAAALRHNLQKDKPTLARAKTDPPSRQNSKKSSGSNSPTSTRSDPYYPKNPSHIQHRHKEKVYEVGMPPQLFKSKQLPNLPPAAEELPFINEVRLVDAYNDDDEYSDNDDGRVILEEAPLHHYRNDYNDDNDYLRRNQSIMSKQSVLGTRNNYKKFISNVQNDHDYY